MTHPRCNTSPCSPTITTQDFYQSFAFDNECPRENVGLLRRAFSSIKRRHKKKSVSSSSSTSTSSQCLIDSSLRMPLRTERQNNLNFNSPASDFTTSRRYFSRRHYGSVELLVTGDFDGKQPQNAGRFRVETGERTERNEISNTVSSPVHLENPEFETRWFFKYFLGKLHQNYICQDTDKEKFVVSVVLTDANNHSMLQYRAILWNKDGAKKICLSYNPTKPQTVKGILVHFNQQKLERGPKEVFHPEVQRELLILEEQEGSVNFKFGVVYAKEGQSSDDEFYSNEEGSAGFYQFLELIGERVKLRGWDKFKAGLDVKSNTTGKESVYTIYDGHEIMFHVSTLLPFSLDNRQQVERKRHIGNDIVNIVFFEGDINKPLTFKPSMMKTRFTHIFMVVIFDPHCESYRLTVFSEESVPLFGPPLPLNPAFANHEEFREFLLVKSINGEKAAVNNPMFTHKRQRTVDMLLRNLYQEYMTDTDKNNVLFRRTFSDVIPDAHGSHRKEEARRLEFVRIGQTLKLKTILKGDAPTSLATTAILKKEPWTPLQYCSNFPCGIVCGDSWGDKLIVSTEDGVAILEENQSPRHIFHRHVPVSQLSVVEDHNLLIMKVDRGKDTKISVFRLTDFDGEVENRSRVDCREHRLEKTRGCHVFAVKHRTSSHLRLAVAVGKRLMLYQWKHLVTRSTWCPSDEANVVESFLFQREFQCADAPRIVTLVDVKDDNYICIGYKSQFDLICEKTGDTVQLFSVDATKANLISALEVHEEDETEMLLSYNHVSHFQKLNVVSSPDLKFYWNSEPYSIVCAFPYVMSFTSDTIEIRLIINGNLVHTSIMPDITLISAKNDIYFASTAPNSASPKGKKVIKRNFSPPSSPQQLAANRSSPCYNIYKIPLACLSGRLAFSERSPTNLGENRRTNLLAPVSVRDRSLITTKNRNDSSPSECGITILCTSGQSPTSSHVQHVPASSSTLNTDPACPPIYS